ncbi:MAG: zf-TFIIB domain-containing protein [Desulfobulbaceae bacterium]|nr:zf-TFIIB domain-containing protein [Desulfobulbaceae bacterium]
MKCPICITTDLLMSDRQGVEIDYCPQCRGVWLDRGELDKIIERSSSPAAPASPQQPSAAPEQRHREPDHSSSHTKYGHGHDHHHDAKHGFGNSYKKKSLLKELFDF